MIQGQKGVYDLAARVNDEDAVGNTIQPLVDTNGDWWTLFSSREFSKKWHWKIAICLTNILLTKWLI